MKSDMMKFFTLQRQIFGICPRSGQFFRLSDCKVYRKVKPVRDWMDKLEDKEVELDALEQKIENIKSQLREKAREKGRQEANRKIRKIDKVFTPRRINPDDAKVLLHPIDYVVFNGMKSGGLMKNIILLDRKTKSLDHRRMQSSIEKTIERGNYEWVTLRVGEDGEVTEDT